VKLTTHLRLVPRLRMHGAIPQLPQYVFMVWCLVKQRDNFTFNWDSWSVTYIPFCSISDIIFKDTCSHYGLLHISTSGVFADDMCFDQCVHRTPSCVNFRTTSRAYEDRLKRFFSNDIFSLSLKFASVNFTLRYKPLHALKCRTFPPTPGASKLLPVSK
jgi:hypothetical protein